MKNAWGLFVMIVVVMIAALYFDDSNDPRQYAVQSNDAMPYGLNPLQNTWPPMGDNPSEVAKDLFASNYYIIFDGSGSMSEKGCSGNNTKLAVAKEAMAAFLENMPTDANVGLFIFDDIDEIERTQLSTMNKSEIMEHIRASNAGGDTPLKTAINAGYKALTAQASKQLGYGEYHLVIITDGAASKGENPEDIVQRIHTESPIVINTVGFCIGNKHSLNQAGLVNYKAANDSKSLLEGLEAVLAESPNFDTDSFDGK